MAAKLLRQTPTPTGQAVSGGFQS